MMATKQVVHRSAKSGRFVTEKFAKSHPNTTVRETNKIAQKRKGK